MNKNKNTAKTTKKGTAQKKTTENSQEIFLALIEKCKKTYDYNDELKSAKEKLDKIQAQNQLIEMARDSAKLNKFFIPNMNIIMQMIELNIFRPLANIRKAQADAQDGIVGEIEIDYSWNYIQGVYEIFLAIVLSDQFDQSMLKAYINRSFVERFLDLFDSQNPSEREYLKNILHKIYAKVIARRKMIRRTMDQLFNTLINEGHRFNGVAEILDIYASIISGFAVPLREEHVIFFKNIMLPLHKVQTNPDFFEQLMRGSMLYLTKDRTLAPILIEGLLKYWPFASTEKETLFLSELSEVIEVADPASIDYLIPKLFKRLVKCIGGQNMHVCDRSMCFFENQYFLNIVKIYKAQTFPILVPTIVELSENHWQKVLLESLLALKQILKDVDPQAFVDAQAMSPSQMKPFQVKQTENDRRQLDKKWELINNQLQQKVVGFTPPALPFITSVVPMEFNEVYSKIYDKVKMNAE